MNGMTNLVGSSKVHTDADGELVFFELGSMQFAMSPNHALIHGEALAARARATSGVRA